MLRPTGKNCDREFVKEALQRSGEKCLLVLEVPVDSYFGHPCFECDSVHAGAIVAPRGKELPRGANDSLPGIGFHVRGCAVPRHPVTESGRSPTTYRRLNGSLAGKVSFNAKSSFSSSVCHRARGTSAAIATGHRFASNRAMPDSVTMASIGIS